MESGELEYRKVFEENTTKNVQTVIAYTTETRELVRKQEEEVKHLKNMIVSQSDLIKGLQGQLAVLQSRIFVGGTE